MAEGSTCMAEPNLKLLPFTLFRMGFFGAAHKWGAFWPFFLAPLPKIRHTSYSNETWHSYTLPKEDPKNV